MADWIAETFNTLGYWGIALAMFLENVFPPIPSEAVLPGAGMTARRGELSLIGVMAAGSAGSLAGAVLWYYIGLWVGTERLKRWADRKGKYIGFSAKDIERADAWFDRWGGPAVFFGRMIPGIRTLISVPAGISGMSFGRFLAYSAAGTILWSVLLVMVGWWLGQSAKLVEQAISWAGTAVAVGIVVWLARRIWKAHRRHRRSDAERQASSTEDRAELSWNEQDRDPRNKKQLHRDGRRSMKTLSTLDARRLLDQDPDVTVIETTPEGDYEEFHLPNAKHIPFDDRFEERVRAVAPDPAKPVIVYGVDSNGDVTRKAAHRLERMGYRQVYEFPDGKIGWKVNGLPTE